MRGIPVEPSCLGQQWFEARQADHKPGPLEERADGGEAFGGLLRQGLQDGTSPGPESESRFEAESRGRIGEQVVRAEEERNAQSPRQAGDGFVPDVYVEIL